MRFVILGLSVMLIISGCGQSKTNQQSGSQQQSGQQQQSGSQQSKTQAQGKQGPEEQLCYPIPTRHFEREQLAKTNVQQVRGVDEAVVVQIDKDLSVAIKVTNFNRLRLKAIRKEVAQKLKETFADENIYVTSDKKLFKDLRELQDSGWPTDHAKKCKQQKRLKKIEKKMNG